MTIQNGWVKISSATSLQIDLIVILTIEKSLAFFIVYTQGGEGRVSEAENLRSSSAIQSIFNLLGRTGKIIIFIIQVGI